MKWPFAWLDVTESYRCARWLDPQTGRFLSQDPIGFDAGDANLYRYVGNDPVNRTDPSGLQATNPVTQVFSSLASNVWSDVRGATTAVSSGIGDAIGYVGGYLQTRAAAREFAAETYIDWSSVPDSLLYQPLDASGFGRVTDTFVNPKNNKVYQTIVTPDGDLYNRELSGQTVVMENPSTGTQAAIAGMIFTGGQIIGAGIRGGWAAGATAFGREIVEEAFQTGLETGINAATGVNIPVPIGLPSRGASGGALTTRPRPALAAPSVQRLTQDINANPTAPRPLPVNRSIGGSAAQQRALQADIRRARVEGATDIRVNQQQVNAAGQRVGLNRPDLQYTRADGTRVYIEYDNATPGSFPNTPRGPAHGTRIQANDPQGAIELRLFP